MDFSTMDGRYGMELYSRAVHMFRASPYHYIPKRGIAIMFIVLFAISTIIHAGQAAYYRMWWLFPTVCLCGVLEILGWSGRLWSSFDPPNPEPFEMQITATILGPTPFLAANFVIFGIIIQRLGTQFSRLSPKWYTILFCTCDVISLVVQGVGGGKAAVAVGNLQNPNPGGHIMLGGISFQLLTITVYGFCALEFYTRYFFNKPFIRGASIPSPSTSRSSTGSTPDSPPLSEKKTPDVHNLLKERAPLTNKLLIMSGALLFSTTCLFIRAVYRTIELSDGWTGRIISTQVYFNVLDGGMIILTVYTLNILHPGMLLGARSGLNHGSMPRASDVEKGET